MLLLDVMATVAKRFRAVDYLSKTISPFLLQPFAKRFSRHTLDQDQEQNTLNREAHLAKIAYLLEQEAMFCVFTRRMILDHSVPLSQLEPSLAAAFEPLLLRKSRPQRPQLESEY
jgi:hypothetical protein